MDLPTDLLDFQQKQWPPITTFTLGSKSRCWYMYIWSGLCLNISVTCSKAHQSMGKIISANQEFGKQKLDKVIN